MVAPLDLLLRPGEEGEQFTRGEPLPADRHLRQPRPTGQRARRGQRTQLELHGARWMGQSEMGEERIGDPLADDRVASGDDHVARAVAERRIAELDHHRAVRACTDRGAQHGRDGHAGNGRAAPVARGGRMGVRPRRLRTGAEGRPGQRVLRGDEGGQATDDVIDDPVRGSVVVGQAHPKPGQRRGQRVTGAQHRRRAPGEEQRSRGPGVLVEEDDRVLPLGARAQADDHPDLARRVGAGERADDEQRPRRLGLPPGGGAAQRGERIERLVRRTRDDLRLGEAVGVGERRPVVLTVEDHHPPAGVSGDRPQHDAAGQAGHIVEDARGGVDDDRVAPPVAERDGQRHVEIGACRGVEQGADAQRSRRIRRRQEVPPPPGVPAGVDDRRHLGNGAGDLVRVGLEQRAGPFPALLDQPLGGDQLVVDPGVELDAPCLGITVGPFAPPGGAVPPGGDHRRLRWADRCIAASWCSSAAMSVKHASTASHVALTEPAALAPVVDGCSRSAIAGLAARRQMRASTPARSSLPWAQVSSSRRAVSKGRTAVRTSPSRRAGLADPRAPARTSPQAIVSTSSCTRPPILLAPVPEAVVAAVAAAPSAEQVWSRLPTLAASWRRVGRSAGAVHVRWWGRGAPRVAHPGDVRPAQLVARGL